MNSLPIAHLAATALALPPAVMSDLRFIAALVVVTAIPVWLDRRLRGRNHSSHAERGR